MGNQNVTLNVRLAQLDRAFGYGPKGREFESSNARERKPRKHNVYEVFCCSKTYAYIYFGIKIILLYQLFPKYW